MIDRNGIAEIIGLYSKHGWKLSRVLLSEELKRGLGEDATGLFRGADVRNSDINAAWFTRSPRPGDETWELRRLSTDAFALCEVFSDEDDDDTREEAMFEMEERMRG